MILAAVSLLGPRDRLRVARDHQSLSLSLSLSSSLFLLLSYFRRKTDVRRREDPREIHARVKTRRNDADSHGRGHGGGGEARIAYRGGTGLEHVRNGGRERERERGRGSDTHAGGTTHVGPVICWTPHGHVVFHGHGVHSIVHFLALSRGVSYLHHGPVQLYGPGGLRATRIDIDIQRRASDVNYIEKESKRRWEGERERGRESEREWFLSSLGERQIEYWV